MLRALVGQMSTLVTKIASATMLLAFALASKANAENHLPPCPKDEGVIWNDCQGTHTLRDGQKYVGEWKDGKGNGQGIFTWPDGAKYVGEVRNGTKNGQGVFTWRNGEKYVGDWQEDKFNGQGTYTWPDGRKYVGEWQNNERNGRGTLTWPDGASFVGEWKGNMKNGHGTMYLPDGSILVSGIWADDHFNNFNEELVAMKIEGGVYVVPVRFNWTITLNAVIDSGAADVSVPSDVVSTLIRSKTISDEDFIGVETYVLADGTEVPSPRFRIRSLQVGSKILENVTASVASAKAEILLGQSFLSRLNSWSIDNDRHVLILR